MGIRQDLIDYRVAFKRRYPISDELKQKVLDRVEAILDDPLSTKRELVAAAKVVLAAEQQNQADEKTITDNERILAFAERIGIRSEVEAATQVGSSGFLGVSDADK